MEENIRKYIRLGEMSGEYLSNASEEESSELAEWLNESERNQEVMDEMASDHFILTSHQFHASVDSEREYELFQQRRSRQTIRRVMRFVIPAAAAVLIGVGMWSVSWEESTLARPEEKIVQHEILPGRHRAILITSNNEEIQLDGEAEKISDGQVVANSSASSLSYQENRHYRNQEKTPYHRLIVPVRGEYQLILSDGTKVWINAQSELSYPVVFNGSKREVFLKGEAYFEVAHNSSQPFHVRTSNLHVGVTGTSFNVSAYPEEVKSHVTLVDGSVDILKDEKIIASLTPGKQLDYIHDSEEFKIAEADVEYVLAWKNGLFLFKNEPLSSIINKLKRWYNVDFRFSTPAEDNRYSGSVRREASIEKILNILRLTNEIDFKIGATNEIEITATQQ